MQLFQKLFWDCVDCGTTIHVESLKVKANQV